MALLISLLIATSVPLPGPLRAFLQSNPEFHLLSLSDVGEIGFPMREDELSSFAVGDANGDGKRDVVAAVVRVVNGRSAPSVIAFNGRGSRYGPVQWVLKDHEHVVTGISIRDRTHRIIVWECIECDSSPWFRWNGVEYEEALWAKGDLLEVAPDLPARVFDRADSGGTLVAELPSGTGVTVLAASPKREGSKRWYEVRAKSGPNVVQGFVDAGALWENYPHDW